jgi:DNA-directed RNA polymerase subunit M/transcription elongation factor TFIIS
MKFCPECESMLHYAEESEKLTERCKNCGYKDICQDRVIETTNYKKSNMQSLNSKNYSRYDNTLSRTIHKECPNNDCPSKNNKALQEAVFYPDSLTMKLIYICTVCNTQWQYS